MKQYNCDYCNKEFVDYPSNRTKKHVYCSKECVSRAKIGSIPWNKGFGEYMAGQKNHFFGKKHTKAALKKILKGNIGRVPWNKGIKQWTDKRHPMLGRKHSEETISKLSKSHLGKHPWNYGEDTIEKKILNKRDRVRFRDTMQQLVFKRDNYTCQTCGATKDLQVDHIQPWSEYVELRFCIDNCRTLCKSCHYNITFGKPMLDIKTPWGHNLKKGGYSNFR